MKTLPKLLCVVAMIALAAALVACSANGASGSASGASSASASSASVSASGSESSASQSVESAGDPLSLWSDDAPLKKALIDYVEAVTDESSPNFIPVEDRVATFDFDGTLFCETDPNYFDYTLLVHRVLEDPDYKDKASDFEKSVANKIVDQNENGTKYDELPVEHGQAVASAFKGMTVDEFYDYVHEFMKQRHAQLRGHEARRRLLPAHGAGGPVPAGQRLRRLHDVRHRPPHPARHLLRPSCPITLPLSHILGSDESLVGSNQGDEDGLDYTFGQDEELVLGGDFYMKTLKENKCYIIQREVAKQPVLSFGNSSGDFAMDNYALSNPTYKSAAFQLCCDDLERENGNLEKAEEMLRTARRTATCPFRWPTTGRPSTATA